MLRSFLASVNSYGSRGVTSSSSIWLSPSSSSDAFTCSFQRCWSSTTPATTSSLLQQYGSYEDFKDRLRGLGDGRVHLELNPIYKHHNDNGVVATVILDNPKRKNALSGKMMAELSDVVLSLEQRFNQGP